MKFIKYFLTLVAEIRQKLATRRTKNSTRGS